MSPTKPSIAVLGAGAVGGYYGARLIQHGHDVHLLTPSDCKIIREKGLEIQSRDGDFSLSPDQIHVYENSADMPSVDLVLVTLKTTANHLLGSLIHPLVRDDTAILTLQNGLGNEEQLAELFGADRILGGMAFVCINRISPGKIVHSDHGLIRLGEFQGEGDSPRAKNIAQLFSASNVPCQVVQNLLAGRWEKLVWNVPFNGLGGLLNRSTDQLIGSEEDLALVRQLMREVISTAQAAGIDLNFSLIEEKIEHTKTMGAYKSSMQIDRELSRPMEVEAIIGQVVRTAQKYFVSIPALQTLYSSLKLS